MSITRNLVSSISLKLKKKGYCLLKEMTDLAAKLKLCAKHENLVPKPLLVAFFISEPLSVVIPTILFKMPNLFSCLIR